ncbi:class I SAM-dependent methyltransferase [Amycolatopsis sp. K13G38]|uniref:Class I SAM-dependent methyltransferase n=1 Tax=Amycolatopsis acididurans TaxID=2724524 RepID=A0ABX1IUX2_9PSEU|nr:class I SAM-dependent methyltransferase [Amycolatopsis acididurans]
MDQRFWDELYGSAGRLWSGRPNDALVAEVTGIPPGRALDVGCGEGGDAHWLARQGWQVTGIDISRIALERAAALAGDLDITWRRLDLRTEAPDTGYDLVSAHYFAFPRDQEQVLQRVLAAVAPGGSLLITSHAGMEERHQGLYRPEEIAARLGEDWRIVVDEQRTRTLPANGHTEDVVLRARRR